MHLSFNSIDELNAFLNWAGDYRGHILAEPVVPGVLVIPPGVTSVTVDVGPGGSGAGGHSVFTMGDGSPADQEAKDLQCGPYDPAFAATKPADDAKPSVNPEPVKRKRRTKAEIEADEAEAAIARAAEATKTQEPATDDPPKPSEGINPFDTVQPPDTPFPATPADAAAEPEAADTTVTPFQHLTRAREFIAKHGMPKYNESFAKAGLDANVMGYSAYQRALHMDALAALESA